jgi:hypothetical protein
LLAGANLTGGDVVLHACDGHWNDRQRFGDASHLSYDADFHHLRLDFARSQPVYCLRHAAICMRIILSHGKVNIFNLAKNAGTSVEQIERFYAKHLPLSRGMAMNLQSFGEG